MLAGEPVSRMDTRAIDRNEPRKGAPISASAPPPPTWKSPVPWARFGLASRLIARALRTRRPHVLLISLPRSGSSWIGLALGSASNALYLREPITQSHLGAGADNPVFEVDPFAPPPLYAEFATRTFDGWPALRPGTVDDPGQWRLRERASRRLVVKEVNLFALGWLTRRYSPRVVLLLRHPAAIASSFERLGWDPCRHMTGRASADAPAQSPATHDFWACNGRFQGRALRHARDALAKYPDHCVVRYEDLCENPVRQLRQLYDFCELTWTATVEALVHDMSSGSEDGNLATSPYAVRRDSTAMTAAWRERVAPGSVARLRAAYLHFGLPWYGSDDW